MQPTQNQTTHLSAASAVGKRLAEDLVVPADMQYAFTQHQAALQQLAQLLQAYPQQLNDLCALIQRCWQRLASTGWPQRRLENWRHTFAHPGHPRHTHAQAPQNITKSSTHLVEMEVDYLRSSDLLAQQDAAVPHAAQLPRGVRILSIQQVLDQQHGAQQLLAQWQLSLQQLLDLPHTDYQQHSMALLAAATSFQGFIVHIDAEVQLDKLLHLRLQHLSAQVGSQLLFIDLQAGVKAELLVEFCSQQVVSESASRSITAMNWLLHMHVGAQSQLTYQHLQALPDKYYVNYFAQCNLQQSAQLKASNALFGAGYWREDWQVYLQQSHADAAIHHLVHNYCQAACMQVRCHLHHLAAHGSSQQSWRGLAQSAACLLQHSLVEVSPGATATHAEQDNAAILLDKTSKLVAEPCLLIKHDAVRCAHAAVVGCLNQRALFYLQTRGIEKQLAEQMLMQAFSDAVWQQFSDPALVDYAKQQLVTYMPAAKEACFV